MNIYIAAIFIEVVLFIIYISYVNLYFTVRGLKYDIKILKEKLKYQEEDILKLRYK